MYLPIGYNCYTTYLLIKLNLRKTSLPFDWISNPYGYIQKIFNINNTEIEISKFVESYFKKYNFDGEGVDKMRHNGGTQFPHISGNSNWTFPNKDELNTIKKRIKRFKDILLENKIIKLVCCPIGNYKTYDYYKDDFDGNIHKIFEIFDEISQYRKNINLEFKTYLITINF